LRNNLKIYLKQPICIPFDTTMEKNACSFTVSSDVMSGRKI
jgi:hypothetical protein